MAPFHVLILGAGPSGLSAALSLSRLASKTDAPSSPSSLHVTVLELRPQLTTTLGGSVNLTPLALRYLDRLGVGSRLRPRGIPVRAIEMVSLRTGIRLGRLWPDVDAMRAKRHDLVSAMLDTARSEEHAKRITVRYGTKVVSIREEGPADADGGRVVLTLDSGEEISGDMLLGCDGLHSVVRRLYVEPTRTEVYSGKAVAYGFVPVEKSGDAQLLRPDGGPVVQDTSIINGRYGSLMLTFCAPERDQVHIAAVMAVDEEVDAAGDRSRDGWRLRAEDKQKVRQDILSRFTDGNLPGIKSFLEKVDEWNLYPVYILPRDGKWSRGRVMLLGDAAHAMPPQGESTGVAIEDGVLLAHVLSRRATRNVSQMIADYEALRRQVVDGLWKEADWRWQGAATPDAGWLSTFMKEWVMSSAFFIAMMNRRSKTQFTSDVETLQLPV